MANFAGSVARPKHAEPFFFKQAACFARPEVFMADNTEPRPRVDPNAVHREDALSLAIGEYVQAFAVLDMHLSFVLATLVGAEVNTIFFLLKDLFFAQKSTMARRASIDKLGEEKSAPLRRLLNRINDAAEFRNDLMHGTFLKSGGPEGEVLHGKIGRSANDLLKGFTGIDYASVKAEAKNLEGLVAELEKWLSDYMTEAKRAAAGEGRLT